MSSRRSSNSAADDFVVPAEGETFAADDGTVSQVMDALNPTEEEIAQYAETNMALSLPEDNRYLPLVRELLTHPLPAEWKPCRSNGEVYYFNFRTGESSWDHPMHEEYMDRIEDEKERAAASPQLQQPRTSGATGLAPPLAPSTGTAPPLAASAAPRRIQSEAEKQLEARIREEMSTKYETEAKQAAELHAAKLNSLKHLHEQDIQEARAADAKRRESLVSAFESKKRARLQAVRERCDNEYRTELTDLGLKSQSLTKQLNQLSGDVARASQSTEKAEAERAAKDDLAKAMRSLHAEVNTYRLSQQKEKDSAFSRQKREAEAEVQKAVEAARAELEPVFAKDIDAAQERDEAARRDVDSRVTELKASLARVTKSIQEADATRASAADDVASLSTAADDALLAKTAALDAARAALETLQAKHKSDEEAFRKTHEQQLVELRQQLRSASSQPSSTLAPHTKTNLDDSTNSQHKADEPVKVTIQTAPVPKTQRLPTSIFGGGGKATTAATSPLSMDEQRKQLESRYAQMKQKALALLSTKRQAALAAVGRSSSNTATSSTTAAPTASGTAITASLKEEHAREQAEFADRYKAMEERLTAQLARELSNDAYSTKTAFDKDTQQEVMDFEFDLYVEQVTARRDRMQREADIKRDKMLADHELAMAAHERHKAQNEARQQSEKAEMREAMLDDLVKDRLEKEREKYMSASSASLRRRESQYAAEEAAIRQEVDEEIQAYERAERKEAEQRALAERQRRQRDASAQQKERDAALQQEAQQREAFDQRMRAAADAVAAVTKELATAREAARTAGAANEAALNELATTLRRIESEAVKAKTEPIAAAPSTVPLTPSEDVAKKKVQPPDSLLRSVHKARLEALEESYQAQVTESTAEVDQWRARRLALPSPSTPAVAPPEAADTHAPAAPTSPTGLPTTQGVNVSDQALTTRSGFLNTAQYIADQQEQIHRRQQALLSARTHYQQERQQSVATALTYGDQDSVSAALPGAPPRGLSAAPAMLWSVEPPASAAPFIATQPAPPHSHGGGVITPFHSSLPAGLTSGLGGEEHSVLNSQLASAVWQLNSRLEQLSSQVTWADAMGTRTASRDAQPRSLSARGGANSRRTTQPAEDRGRGHSSYRAQKRTTSSSPQRSTGAQSRHRTSGREDISHKWNSLLESEIA